MTWASVFEKEDWSTGDAEITSTLLNISDHKEGMTDAVAERLRQALKGSKMLKDKYIMSAIKSARNTPYVDKDDWWWWPEKL